MAAEQDIRFRGDASDAIAAVEQLRKALGSIETQAAGLKKALGGALDADSRQGVAEAKQYEHALQGIDTAAESVKRQLKDAYAASSKGGTAEAGQMEKALERVGATAGVTQKQIKDAYAASSRGGVTEADQLSKALELVDVQARKMKSELKDAYNTSSAAGVTQAEAMDKAIGKSDGSTRKFHSTLTALKVAGVASFIAIGAAAGVAGAAIVGGFAIGINEMNKHQETMAAVEAHIKSTGAVAGVTSKHVEALANSILNYSGADDEAVASGEGMLLTFKNIRNVGPGVNAIFDRATTSLVDMATSMNHGATPNADQLTKSAIQLGKALNDPIKGMTALRRVGVTFTQSQQDAIKAMVASGDVIGAQKAILKELEGEFGGAAKAAGETFPGQLHILKETFDNTMGDMATKAVPVLLKALGGLKDALPAIESAFTSFGNLVYDVVTGIGTKALPVLKQALQDLPGAIDAIKPVLKTAFDAIGNGIAVSLTIGRDAITAFGPALKGLASVAVDTLDGITKEVQKHQDDIKLGFGSMGEAVQKAWTGIEPTVRTAMQGIVQAVGPALNAFKEIGNATLDMVNAFGKILGPLEPVFILLAKLVGLGLIVFFESVALQARAIGTAFTLAGDAAQYIWKLLGDLYDVLRQVSDALGITGAIKAVGDALQGAGKWVADFASKLGGDFMAALQAAPGAIRSAFDYITSGGLQRDVTNGLKALPGLVLQLIKAAFTPSTYTPLIHGAFTALVNINSWLTDKLSGLGSTLKGILGGALDSAKDYVLKKATEIVLKIIDPFTHLPSWLGGGWAKDLKKNLEAGLQSAEGEKKTAAIVGDVIGRAMADGIISPIEKAAIRIVKSITAMVTQVQSAIAGISTGTGGTGVGAGKGLGHGTQVDSGGSGATGRTSKGVYGAYSGAATHQTDGLPGFPAVDIYVDPGTPVLAPEDGRLESIRGNDPALGVVGAGGVYGYSLYYLGTGGTTYYMTHLLKVAGVGSYKKGQVIAIVGKHPTTATHVHVGEHQGAFTPSGSDQPATLATPGYGGADNVGGGGDPAKAPGTGDVTVDNSAAKKAAAAAASALKKAMSAEAKKLTGELNDVWADFHLVPPEMKDRLDKEKAELSKLLEGTITPADRAKFKAGLDALQAEIRRGVDFEAMVKTFETAQKDVEKLLAAGFFSPAATKRIQGDVDELVALKKKFLADGTISAAERATYKAALSAFEKDLYSGFAQVGTSAKKAIQNLVKDGTLTASQGAQLTKGVSDYMAYLKQAWKDHKLDPDELKKLARLSDAFDLKNLIEVGQIKSSIDATMKQIGTLFAQGFVSLEDYIRAQQWEKRLKALIAAATGKNSPGGAMITPAEMKAIQGVWDQLTGIIGKGADDALMNAEKLKYLAPTVQPAIDQLIGLFREGVISADDFNRFVNIPQEIADAWKDGIITPAELDQITTDINDMNNALKQGAADLKANQTVWADLGRDVTKAIADNWLSPSEIEVIRKKGANLKGAFKDALDEALTAYDDAKKDFETAADAFKQSIYDYFDNVIKPKLRLQVDTSNALLELDQAEATINATFTKLFGPGGPAFTLGKPITSQDVEAQFQPVYHAMSNVEKGIYGAATRLIGATEMYWQVIGDPNSTKEARDAATAELANAGQEWQNVLDSIPPDDADAQKFADGFGLIITQVGKSGEAMTTATINSWEKASDENKFAVGQFIDGIVGQLEAGTITWGDAVGQIGVVLAAHGIDANQASVLLGKAATDPLHEAFGKLTTAIGNLETTLERIAKALEKVVSDAPNPDAVADAIADGPEKGAKRLENAANRIVTAAHTINGTVVTGPGGPVVDPGDNPAGGGGKPPDTPNGTYVADGVDPDTGATIWKFVPNGSGSGGTGTTPVSPSTTATTTTTTTVTGGTGHYEDDGSGNQVWIWDTPPTTSTTVVPPPSGSGAVPPPPGGRGPQLWTGGLLGVGGAIEAFARGGVSGMVRGVASKGIDSVLARLTPGELVLNGHQQKRLGHILGRAFGAKGPLSGKSIFKLARGYADGGVVLPPGVAAGSTVVSTGGGQVTYSDGTVVGAATYARYYGPSAGAYASAALKADFVDPTLQGDLGGYAIGLGAPMGTDAYSTYIRAMLLQGSLISGKLDSLFGGVGQKGLGNLFGLKGTKFESLATSLYDSPFGDMFKLMYEITQRTNLNPLILGYATTREDALKLWNSRNGFRPALTQQQYEAEVHRQQAGLISQGSTDLYPTSKMGYGIFSPASRLNPNGLQPGEKSVFGATSELGGNRLFHPEADQRTTEPPPVYVRMVSAPDPNDPTKTIQVMKAFDAWSGMPINLVKNGLQPGQARNLGGVMQVNAPFSFAGMSQYERQLAIGEYLKDVGFLDSGGVAAVINGQQMHRAIVTDPVTGATWDFVPDVTQEGGGGGGGDSSGDSSGSSGSSGSGGGSSTVDAINAWHNAISWWDDNKPIERALGGFIGDELGGEGAIPWQPADGFGPPMPLMSGIASKGIDVTAGRVRTYVVGQIAQSERSPLVTPSWAYRRASGVRLPAGVGRYSRPASSHYRGAADQWRGDSGGGGTHVYITVEGSVVRDRDLVEQVRDGLTRIARRNGDVSGGTWGG